MGSFRLASLFAVTVAVSLMLGTAPREVRAGVCDDLNQAGGCVVPNDLRKNAVRSKHRKDEAGVNFVSKGDAQQEISSGKVYASIVIQAPAAGTVIVNAGITIQALKNPGPGTGPGVRNGVGIVECALTAGGTVIDVNNPNRFFGSVDWDEDIEYETIAITRGFALSRKTDSTIALVCKVIGTSGNVPVPELLRVRSPSISAVYYSNLN